MAKNRNKSKRSSKISNNREQKRFDESYLMYGKHAVFAALKNKNRKILRIISTEKNIELINEIDSIDLRNIQIETATRQDIDRYVKDTDIHQGIIAEVMPIDEIGFDSLLTKKNILILDQITDSQNIGAIWRNAAAFNTDAIILTKDNCPAENALWAKNASGTLETLPLIRVTNLSSIIKELKKNDFWIIGMDGYSKTPLKDVPDYDKKAIIMGSEGKGMRKLTTELCDITAYIPIAEDVESLNVSSATAITLYQIFKN